MRRLLILLVAVTAFAQSPDVTQKLREAQKEFGAGNCPAAQSALREVLAADPQNYVAHLLSAHCLLREKDYKAAAGEFRRTLEIRPGTPQGILGLIEAHARAGDKVHRDAEVAHLRTLMGEGRLPKTLRFVREQVPAGDKSVVVAEYPFVTALRSRYVFDVFDAQQKLAQQLELVTREEDQQPGGARRFSLVRRQPEPATVRVYDRGEPSYAQVLADVKKVLANRTPAAGDYTLAAAPAVVEPLPITADDRADPRLSLKAGEVAIEYVAHSCFRIHSPGGARVVIDPFASRVWLGYDFPRKLAADAVLITHPHYDHDADVLLGNQPPPWAPGIRVMRDPGYYKVADVAITGVRGRHADPWGKEFGQSNTIWLLDVGGLRIAHLGDNGPLTEANVQELGRVDIVMMPIDAQSHILKPEEIEAIRKALHPRVVIPMHYRIPDLELSSDGPQDLGELTPWLSAQKNVVALDSSAAVFDAATLLPSQIVVVFPHSSKVSAPPR